MNGISKMTILNSNYQIESGEYGSAIITITGRCTADEITAIEADCCRDYKLIKIPNASGVIFKALDGSNPSTTTITPSTFGKSYTCVKVDGRCNPLAPVQTGGTYNGKAVLRFMKRYQEVASLA